MSNECLVTKLKGAVNNDSLVRLNELPIYVNFSDGNSHNITVRRIYNVRGDNDLAPTLNDVTVTLPNGTYKAFVSPKSSIVYLTGQSNAAYYTYVKAEDIKYTQVSALLTLFDGDLADLPSTVESISAVHPWYSGISSLYAYPTGSMEALHNLTQFTLQDCADRISGSLSTFVTNNPTCTKIKLTTSTGAVFNVTGSITDAVPLWNTLTELDLHGSKVTGAIEDLLVGMLGEGKTSGSISIIGLNWATFHEEVISDGTAFNCTFGSNSITVKRSNVTVATYNGSVWTYA